VPTLPDFGAKQHEHAVRQLHRDALDEVRAVAVRVEFERHILKPVFHLIGAGLKPGAFQLWVRGSQRAPPRRAGVAEAPVRLPRGAPVGRQQHPDVRVVLTHSPGVYRLVAWTTILRGVVN
jgi:hypothetical protein